MRRSGIRIGRVLGIELILDRSLVVIFLLVVFSLGFGTFRMWHPEWHPALTWGLAIAGAAGFFGSILLHELSHAAVARRFGIPVRSITLFLFGGVADIEREPPSPRAEFLIGAAGPLASFLIGAGCLAIGGLAIAAAEPGDPATALRDVGPAATMLLWLGPANIVLALFNLLPGLPLDGGRILRALLWWGSDDPRRATRWTAASGQAIAWILVACGVAMTFGVRIPFLGQGLAAGMWVVLIGWFLNVAAATSRQESVIRELLHVPVDRVMSRALPLSVSPDLSVGRFVSDVVMATEHRAFPVEQSGELLGVVSMDDVRKVPRAAWDVTPVRDIMTPAAELNPIGIDANADEALQRMVRGGLRQIPVVEGGRLRGWIRRDDLARWLSLQSGTTEKLE